MRLNLFRNIKHFSAITYELPSGQNRRKKQSVGAYF